MPSKAILNSLIAGLVSCLFAIGFKYFGIYLIFLSYFSALPIFISGLYYGMTGIFISAIFSIIIMTFFTSFNVGILFFITNILPITLILFERSKNKFNYLNFISKLTLISSILYILINYFYIDKINKTKKGSERSYLFDNHHVNSADGFVFSKNRIAKTNKTIERSLRTVVMDNRKKMKPAITDEEKGLQILAQGQ